MATKNAPKQSEDEKKKGITVTKEQDMAEWYQQVCLKSEVAEYAPVKGCYVLRPLGYAFWQQIQDYFNDRMRRIKVQNAYFPLFIPESFFHKEAEHAEGFSPQVAWIANTEEGAERLALRPTSETIMYDSYSRWIRSWRDLPLRINQWCNIVRWETEATKLFIRSREFLWQEGHCVYETKEECDQEVELMLKEYKKLAEELLCVPVIAGRKTDKEKFAGALYTTSIEAFMPDGKALQAGTSHQLGQGFAKAFGIEYLGKDGQKHTPWQSSWGISTRLIGAMIMQHSDNKGLVIPPRMAPNKAVIVPIIFESNMEKILKKCSELKDQLAEFDPILDDREGYTPGWKFNEWEMRGVPVRIEIGPKDYDAQQAVVVRRDTGEKQFIKWADLKPAIKEILKQMQKDLFEKAKTFVKENTFTVNDMDAMTSMISARKLVKAPFCGESACEDYIKEKSGGASSRNIPLGDEKPPKGSKCVHCGKPAKVNTYFAKSY